jgi:predicted transcriptional regulator
MRKKRQNFLDRLAAAPEELLNKMEWALDVFETELADNYELTDEDKAAIDRGLQAAAEGKIATAAQVTAVFGKYRL